VRRQVGAPGFATQRAALAEYRRLLRQRDVQADRPWLSGSVTTVCLDWLQARQLELRPNTLYSYAWLLSLVYPPWAPVRSRVAVSAGSRDGLIVWRIGARGGLDVLEKKIDSALFADPLDRSAQPLLDDCAAAGIAVLNAAPFGSGLLAKGPDATDRYVYRSAVPQIVEAANRMQAACQRRGVPLAAAALQFSIRDPRITSAVLGITRPERVEQTMELARHPIPESLWPELSPAPEEFWLS
jgi:hypothetical protein